MKIECKIIYFILNFYIFYVKFNDIKKIKFSKKIKKILKNQIY